MGAWQLWFLYTTASSTSPIPRIHFQMIVIPASGVSYCRTRPYLRGVTGSTVPRNVNIFWNFFNKYCVNFVICALRCITKRRNCCHQIRFWAASWYWGKGPPKGGRKGRGGKRKGEEGRGGWGKGKGGEGEGLSPNENPGYGLVAECCSVIHCWTRTASKTV